MLVIIIFMFLVYMGTEVVKRWSVLSFSYTHPEIVQVQAVAYASASGELNKKFTTIQSSEQEKAYENFNKEIEASKP